MKNKKTALLMFTLVYSLNAFAHGEGVCVTFADGHGECISDVDKDSEMALALKKKASDSFKPADVPKSKTNGFIENAKESSIDMLVKASKKYEEKKISKDQFVEIALQVSRMADYAGKNASPLQPETVKSSEVKLADKKIKVTDNLPFGSPNIENKTDEQLKKLENNEKDIPGLRTKFKELQQMQKDLGLIEINLKCAADADCMVLPIGQKICGGPVSYLLISSLDANFALVSEKLDKFTKADRSFQELVHGFYGTCDYAMPPKVVCQSNVCKAL